MYLRLERLRVFEGAYVEVDLALQTFVYVRERRPAIAAEGPLPDAGRGLVDLRRAPPRLRPLLPIPAEGEMGAPLDPGSRSRRPASRGPRSSPFRNDTRPRTPHPPHYPPPRDRIYATAAL